MSLLHLASTCCLGVMVPMGIQAPGPQSTVAKPSAIELVSVALTSGPGISPAPGQKPAPPELVGVVRINHLDRRKSSFAITLVAPAVGKHPPRRYKVVPATWSAYDPNDRALIRWTCRWTQMGTPEGWSAVITNRRKRGESATASIQHFLLPVAQPRPSSQPSDRQP